MDFQYDRLSNIRSEIRLLRLLPRKIGDPVRVSLRHVCLADKPEYFTLSYTWGSPFPHSSESEDDFELSCGISVNDKPHKIQLNLLNALQELEVLQVQESSPEWWIDAICIDQSCIPERNQQVAMMKDIYHNSDMTIVWLGPSDSTTDMAFSKLRRLVNFWDSRPPELRDDYVLTNQNRDEREEVLKNELTSGDMIQDWEALNRLFSRSWWNRAWVIQEYATSRNVWFLCGQNLAPRKDLFIACGIAIQLRNLIASRDKNIGENMHETILRGILTKIIKLTAYGSLEACTQIYWRSPDEGSDLTTLLSHLRHALATNPRDKVYAAVAMSTSRKDLDIDYSLPVEKVYIELAKHTIRKTESFRVLSHCRFAQTLKGLPSWVPDWSDRGASVRRCLPQKGSHRISVANPSKIYSAAGESKPNPRFEDGDLRMIVRGFVCDIIVLVTPFFGASNHEPNNSTKDVLESNEALIDWTNQENVLNGRRKTYKCLNDWALFQSLKNDKAVSVIDRRGWTYQPDAGLGQFQTPLYVTTGQTLEMAFNDTALADVWDNLEDGRDVRLSREFSVSLTEDEYRDSYPRNFGRRIEGRAFAVTKGEQFALVPCEARIGDLVALIEGSEVPFVLRPCEDDQFQFIGDCYVHGIMDGGLWEIHVERNQMEEIKII